MTQKAKRSTEKPTSTGDNRASVHWVNVRLDDAHIPDLERMYPDEEIVAAWLLRAALVATNLFVKYDEKNESVCAGFIAPHQTPPHELCGVSGWSDTAYDAVRALLYKWFVVLGETWPEVGEATSHRFR